MAVKIKSPFCQGIESASSPGLYSLDVQYFTRTVFPRELGPRGTVFPKGIQSAGPKIGPDRIPYDTGTLFATKIVPPGTNLVAISVPAGTIFARYNFCVTVRLRSHVSIGGETAIISNDGSRRAVLRNSRFKRGCQAALVNMFTPAEQTAAAVASPSVSVRCYNCNGIGHLSRNCRQRPVCYINAIDLGMLHVTAKRIREMDWE